MADLFALNALTPPFTLPKSDDYSAAWDESRGGFEITVPGGSLFYAEQFFNPAWSDRTLAFLQENDAIDWRTTDWRALPSDAQAMRRFTNIRWRQESLKLYGKSIPLPRLTAWYGDPGAAYTYSGIKSEPDTWNDGLLYLKRKVDESAGTTFNSVLLNWYRDGRDSLSWHADDEKELGLDPVIASANFGATRAFQLRRNSDHSHKITMPLKHGTLLVMRGELQRHWKHQVPKQGTVLGSRFNLTFRTIFG